jgi:hypothetical protein
MCVRFNTTYTCMCAFTHVCMRLHMYVRIPRTCDLRQLWAQVPRSPDRILVKHKAHGVVHAQVPTCIPILHQGPSHESHDSTRHNQRRVPRTLLRIFPAKCHHRGPRRSVTFCAHVGANHNRESRAATELVADMGGEQYRSHAAPDT